MLYLFAFCLLFVPTVISAKDEVAANTPQDCSVNNYNNNYYAGPQKNVENLLTDIKKQLDELKTQVALLTKCSTSEGRWLYLKRSNEVMFFFPCTYKCAGSM